MTKTNWLPIKEAYLKGEGTYKQLAERFGVPESTIEKRASREKWTQKTAELVRKVEEKVVESLAQTGIKHAQRMLERYDKWLVKVDKAVAKRKIADASTRELFKIQSESDDKVRRICGMDQRELEAQGAIIPLGGLELQAKILDQIYAIKALVKDGKIKTVDIEAAEVAKMRIVRGT